MEKNILCQSIINDYISCKNKNSVEKCNGYFKKVKSCVNKLE